MIACKFESSAALAKFLYLRDMITEKLEENSLYSEVKDEYLSKVERNDYLEITNGEMIMILDEVDGREFIKE